MIRWSSVARSDCAPYPKSPPFALGSLPRTLFNRVKTHLQGMGVDLFTPREPEARKAPVLFTADDNVIVVADDFHVEVPEFEHRPEWFTP